jgi:hypothetical protein
MKAAQLKNYWQQFIDNVVMAETEHEEAGLGFDAMLSHEVVKFLTTDHSIASPLMHCVMFKTKEDCVLDEHELAMV